MSLQSNSSENSALFEAVACTLSCVLQPDSEIQKLSNERIQKLEFIEEYPLILCEIIGCTEEALPEKHLASVFLKNYLEQIFLNKRENAAFDEKGLGKKISLMLLEHLDINNTHIKLMVSYSLALMLGIGFWDTLTLQLNDMAQSKNADIVHNAVLVLSQAIDVPFFESQRNFQVEQHWFNVLLDVLKMTNIRAETRCGVIRPMFVMMKYVRPNENYVPQCWTKLSEEFEKALNEPFSPHSDFQFKGEIIKCLNGGIAEFREYSNIFITPSLPVIANILTHCREIFKKCLKEIDTTPPKDITEADTEDPTNFTDLIVSILNYIHSMIDMVYFNVLLEDFENLLYCIFIFMSCYNDMEYHLHSNEAETNHHFSMRQAGCQILTSSLQKLEETRADGKAIFFKTLHQVFQRFTHELETATYAVPLGLDKICFVTRITETLIFGVAMVKEKIPPRDPTFAFPIEYYINYWTKLQITKPLNMFLSSRVIWMCGMFAIECPINVLEFQIKTILVNINVQDKHFFLPLAEAMCNFLKQYGNMTRQQQCVISNYARDIIAQLLSITRKEDDFPLNHSLNALGYFIKAFGQISQDNIDYTEDLLVRTVSNHISDPYILKEIYFVVAKLAQSRNFKILIHDKFLTFMYHVIHNFTPSHMRNYIDKSLEILNIFTLYSPCIDEYLILQLFIGGANLLNKTNEPEFEVEETAATLLTTLIVKQITKLKFIQNTPKGQPVIDEFPKLLEAMLKPDVILPPHVCDKLVIIALFEFPELMEPHHENILRSVITSSCRHQCNVIPTWMIFAFISMIRPTITLSYLSLIPGPNGGSALNYIIQKWKPHYVQQLDTIERKIFVRAVIRMIQHCLEDEAIYTKMQEIAVPYDSTEESSTASLTAIEYLYYLLIESVLYDEKERENIALRPGITFLDFGEDLNTKHIEDDRFLYHNHPLNLNIVGHVSSFLKNGNELYFNVLRKYISATDTFKLKSMGCAVPDMSIPEDME